MPEGVWSAKLRELTSGLAEENVTNTQELVARRNARTEEQRVAAADQLEAANAAMRMRGEQSVARAQGQYAAMLQQMTAGSSVVQSGRTALNGVKGKGVALGKSGLTTSESQMTTLRTAQGSVQVNKRYQARFAGFIGDLAKTGYRIGSLGGYNVRNIAGTSDPSLHSYGAAIDINPGPNARGGTGNLPPNIAELAARYGLVWGGNWKYTDPMHFEIAGLLNPIKLNR